MTSSIRVYAARTTISLWALAVTLFLALGCGSDPPAQPVLCSFENCSGCCDGDVCVETPTATACGDGGGACTACGSGETCAGGQCVAVNDCSNCDGCCINGTQCVPGNTVSACGAGGSACTTCASGTGCDGDTGTCQPIRCDATNCSGCCTANGVCLTVDQQTTAACGADGDACATCPAAASDCVQGTCVVDQPCLEVCNNGCCTATGQCIPYAAQDNTTCGGDTGPEVCSACTGQLSCVGGGCVADISWRVSLVSAVISATNGDGQAWDGGLANPLPDPYGAVALTGDTFLDGFTPTIDNTTTPNWNHSFGNYLQSDLLAQGLSVVIRDSDGLGLFQTIGACDITITAAHLSAGSVTKPTCGLASNVVISFARP